MAETAQKAKATEPTEEQKAIAELQAALAELREDNAILRTTQNQKQDEDPQVRELRMAHAQAVVDTIAGGRGGNPYFRPTRKQVRDAISTIEEFGREAIARRRGIKDEERSTMNGGLREHISLLNRCAETYFEREGIGF